MIYRLLLFVFRFALKQYFKDTHVCFEQPLPTDRPILFVANHQSAFMDALVIGAQMEESLHFVSRGESFNSRIKRWILSHFNMHPIYRKEFTPELTKKNPQAIQAFQNLLKDGKSILIFPEGISKTEPRLRKIKTGAARIALGAYADMLGEKAPVIVPVGLNYSNPHQFRSEVTLNYGAAIELESYMNEYAEDAKGAVQALTEKIETELERLTLVIPEETLEEVVTTVKAIYAEELLENENLGITKPRQVFKIKKDVIQAARYFNEHFPFRMNHLKIHVDHYRKLLLNYEVEDCWLRAPRSLKKYSLVFNVFALLIGFPFFAFGFVNHAIALQLSKLVAEKGISRSDFKGSFLLCFGVLFCLLCYATQTTGIYLLTASWKMSLLYLIALPLLGKFSLLYFDFYKKVKIDWRRNYFQESNEEMIAYLKEQRAQLIRLLNMARKDYMALR